ncbi:SusC/RagA family TonB-linked outer membrane protein [Chryseobacterium paridis]|uniref:SusC/RagA family TonB-linked outer membrane protein n=1 Tax=Chryseobacterium paridis TaxID=2800328 RepID=A0ABS1G0T3_9FLAO|nr:SusC/RagA family TonB-linked outer membrane protein [Chryseobacterium paridis]MBK1898274.1 SusC/RagA family TonB-linked outer membrane protein [Chryseobacterium paridis]
MRKTLFRIGLLQSVFFCFGELYAQNKDSIKTAKIDEVVVTAYGVKKEKKSLGYSFQDVKGQTLVDARETNVTNALTGKVAGLQVVKGGFGPASSSRINIRGFNSFEGDSQPLIVVDGIPINNSAGVKGRSQDGAKNNDLWNPDTDMGNGLSDINPDDIETISVLKGGAASALYGARAGNGVILITTKSGKKKGGIGINYSTSLGFEKIFLKPDLQSSFARGSNGLPNLPSNLDNTTSWGPSIDGSDMKVYDNLKGFFKTGTNTQHTISFQESLGEGTSLYTSGNYLYDNSQIPNSKYERWNFMAKMNSIFGTQKRWTTDVKVQYISAKANNRPNGGLDGNTYGSVLLMPRNIDIREYREGMTQNNVTQRWITNNGINPYWAAYNKLNEDKKDRFLISGYLKYQFNDWLSADVRLGSDFYSLTANSKTWTGSRLNNSYNTSQEKFYENNYITSLNARKNDLIGKWGASLSIYGQMMETKTNAIYLSAPNLTSPNFFNINNSVGNPEIREVILNKKINSVFASAEINYDGYWFINATARNDWSSTLTVENRSYFYPSISTSLVITDMLAKLNGTKSNFLSFAKVRASYAITGNSLEPYELYNTFEVKKDPNGNVTSDRKKILYDPNLRNEKLKTFEVGLDLRLFSRFSFDISYYNTKATDQLINLPMNPLSGYEKKKINAGGLQNQGVEIVFNTDIIKNSNFTWNTNVNFSQMTSRIDRIDGEVTKYSLGGFDDVSVFADVGRRYGAIYGSKFKRVEDVNNPYYGKLIVDGNGALQKETGLFYLGNQSPDALFGFTNSFVYKNFGLSFQIDGRIGGEFFSGSQLALQKAGLAKDTAPGGKRDNFVVDGVVAGTNGNYTPNTKEITQQNYWEVITAGNLGITEQNIYDATNIRLRNIQLSYNFPKAMFEKFVIKSAKVAFTANNVWMIYSKANGIDPESVFAISSNAVGFENFAFPTTRSYLFTITLGF